MKRRLGLFIACLVLSASVEAQILTGSIIGAVKDESGAVLPGVTVALTSPALPSGPAVQVTNEKGEYRFTELSPGTYALTVTLAGFSKPQEEDLRVAVGGTTERIVTVKVAAVAETINVSGQSPMVDPRKVGVAANLLQEVVETLPTMRYEYAEYVKWAPGVAPSDPAGNSGSSSVMGSSTSENLFLLEGINTNSPTSGGNYMGGAPNTLQEAQVTTLGPSAEYQIAQGAVYNAVMKEGTNRFQFAVTGYSYPDTFQSKPIKLPCNCPLGQTGFSVKRRDTSGDAGGPIVRDHLWFYAAGIYNVRVETPPGQDPSLPRDYYNNSAAEKVTWQINDKVRVKETYTFKWRFNPSVPSAAMPFATITGGAARAPLWSSEVNWTITNNTLLTARATGYTDPVQYQRPLSGDIVTPFRRDSLSGIACCGVPSISNADLGRFGYQLKVNRYIQRARTTHDVRFGVQLDNGYSKSFNALVGGVNYSDFGGALDQATFRAPNTSGANFWAQGLWGEDQVTFGGRLTLTLGLRFDRMNGISPDLPAVDNMLHDTGATIKGLGDMFTWKAWAPRVGFNLKLSDDGKTILRGTYGRAYRAIFLNDFANVHPGLQSTTLARWNPATNSYSTIISVTDPLANLAVDPNLEAPFTDSYSIGTDHELIANLAVGASYVHKHGEGNVGWKDIGGVYGTQTTVLPDGRTLTVRPLLNAASQRLFLRTNGPGTFTRYDGLILTLDKRMSNRWQASLSYTFSKSYGITTTNQDPNNDLNTTGRLSTDRPNVVSVVTAYHVPKIEVHLAVNYLREQGTPYAPQASVSLPQGRLNINIEQPGAYRFPTMNLLYIRATRDLFRHGSRRLELGAGIDNATQDESFQSLVSQNFFSSTFGQANLWNQPRRMFIWATAKF